MARVLVVDDERDLRVLVGMVLKSIGCEMVEAADGVEALDILRDDPAFDLVITDVHMARMDGVRFLTVLSEQYPTVPVILSSVDFRLDRVSQVIQQGAAAYLPRPFIPRQLIEVVGRVMDRRAHR